MSHFLDREHSVASPGYNRWLVPPAGLLLVAAFCNYLVGPVESKYHMAETGYAPGPPLQEKEK
jgi:hypothetical protein